MAIDFSKVLTELETGLISIAKDKSNKYAPQALQAGKDWLSTMESDLKTWTEQLVLGELSKEDFADLLAGQKDLAKLFLLKQKGMANIAVDDFRDSIFNLVESTVFGLL